MENLKKQSRELGIEKTFLLLRKPEKSLVAHKSLRLLYFTLSVRKLPTNHWQGYGTQ